MPENSGGEALTVIARVAALLERLHVPYAVVGSLASSLHGIPRSTQDADVLAAIEERHVAPLVASLARDFYVDEERARQAVADGQSFNVIHLATMFKVDLFVPAEDRFAASELERRERVELELSDQRVVEVWFASAEDALLHKLYWYRLGGESSDRQWSDVLGVMRVQRGSLDLEYLDRWARELEVADLLERARQESH
ncbi:MAG TPA: DUF6036 family nucleotidyltransferase [Thermoanaerobaculia bacterium]|nr:DUF6036 family nucleotidyltransferase [Thermoanaerobaculia bacterium]